MNLVNVKRPVSDCGIPVIKLVTIGECVDKITDIYYGTGTVISKSGPLVQSFPFQKVTNIKGFVSRKPREIIRQVSQNCRTQKVSSNKPFIIQGGELYPDWKMNEIEDMFHGKRILVDGYEVVFRGGTIFENYRNTCTGQFKLNVQVEECTRSQIYGCTDPCNPSKTHFVIPNDIVTQDFFNDSGIKIASSYALLLSYYRNQSNVLEVLDETDTVSLKCDYYKVFSVRATANIPSFFFYDRPTSANKVFGKVLEDENPDYNLLCGGVDNTACAQVYINTPEVYEIVCDDIVIGAPELFMIGSSCNVFAYPDWVQHTGLTQVLINDTQRILSLSLFNPDYSLPNNPGGGTWTHTMGDENLCAINTPIPSSAIVTQVSVNGIPLNQVRWHFVSGHLIFEPCLNVNDIIQADFGSVAPPVLTGQIVAQISGSNCAPSNLRQFTHDDYNQIPDGSTLIIEPTGNIKWVGPMTTSTQTGSTIEVSNIVYNL